MKRNYSSIGDFMTSLLYPANIPYPFLTLLLITVGLAKGVFSVDN